MQTEVVDPTLASPAAQLMFTERAASKVREMIAEEGCPELKLRVTVSGGGCSGFQYGFSFDDQADEEDTAFDRYGVQLLIDPLSLSYLVGAEIDFHDGLDGSRFVIKNPNAKTSCGCGKSFAT